MKYIAAALVLFISILIYDKSNSEQYDIAGEWQGVYADTQLNFAFYKDQTCLLVFQDAAQDTILKLEGNYDFNCATDPMSLKISNMPQIMHPLYAIACYQGQNRLTLSLFSPSERTRSIAFGGNSTILLTRK